MDQVLPARRALRVPPEVPPGVRAETLAPDHRVTAVLALLAGARMADVAKQYSVDVAVLQRWREAFITAGAAKVTNRPEDRESQQRDRFLAAFAHELRSPLTIAQGWLTVLVDETVDELTGEPLGHLESAQLTPVMIRMQEALTRLSARVLDVELLANAALGRLRLQPKRVTVADILATWPEPVTVTGLGVETELHVDPELFGILVRDLWTAGKSIPTPRTLRLDVQRVGPWLELSVVRDADPIRTSVLQALFEPFELNDDGTGVTIGLYLARALTVVHGGTLGVDQDDEGARLWVRVPDSQVQVVQPPRELKDLTMPTTEESR